VSNADDIRDIAAAITGSPPCMSVEGYKTLTCVVRTSMVAALEAAARAVEWHLAESEPAPRDRPILTWDGKHRAVVQFQKGKEAKTVRGALTFYDMEGFAFVADGLFEPDGDGVLFWWEFTHWTDLPEPPA
jgi:hypothetical protein